MNWGMIAAGIIIAWIGAMMIYEGDNPITRWLGLIVAAVIGGSLLCLGLDLPSQVGYIEPDEMKCAQYVYVVDTWECVPHGQEG